MLTAHIITGAKPNYARLYNALLTATVMPQWAKIKKTALKIASTLGMSAPQIHSALSLADTAMQTDRILVAIA